ncbi:MULTISPECIES: DUF397 domain-containing protein [Streptomyces]|uniref:DUF397 domain-containing protein n=2 Tax=Streptomyces rimosus subsp. rimosus TaxID=132474 RepID=L8EHY3_STRR1|nr:MULTISPECIES: DUF397 domain-containing protein [Streptomyces]KOG76512.1 hypothetical protein ADK78_10635 [Kitasatospora aureofaciens]MYT43846.1 DUF397 domain-containing protein [Streptomyces sp. SID5471]KEF03510.1 hypothetical protein DF17_28095 [Streptomyces rimosus]KEF21204.1 hypothetical protein DF18_08400 [Streptomyces rimosus]KUJ42812.1 hypothetical protein ADK46_03535 [Streptomyces rimosus subsp. rimosus]
MQLHWRKSSYSADTGSCVEVAERGDDVFLREGDDPEIAIRTGRQQLRSFLADTKTGRFDGFA